MITVKTPSIKTTRRYINDFALSVNNIFQVKRLKKFSSRALQIRERKNDMIDDNRVCIPYRTLLWNPVRFTRCFVSKLKRTSTCQSKAGLRDGYTNACGRVVSAWADFSTKSIYFLYAGVIGHSFENIFAIAKCELSETKTDVFLVVRF